MSNFPKAKTRFSLSFVLQREQKHPRRTLQLFFFFFSISKLTSESAAQACPSLCVTGSPFSLSGPIKMKILQKRCTGVPDGGLSGEDSRILHSVGRGAQFGFAYQILLIGTGRTLLFTLTRQHWLELHRPVKKKKKKQETNVCSLAVATFGSIMLQMNVV